MWSSEKQTKLSSSSIIVIDSTEHTVAMARSDNIASIQHMTASANSDCYNAMMNSAACFVERECCTHVLSVKAQFSVLSEDEVLRFWGPFLVVSLCLICILLSAVAKQPM